MTDLELYWSSKEIRLCIAEVRRVGMMFAGASVDRYIDGQSPMCEEGLVPVDVWYFDADSQRDCSRTFETQRDQSFPIAAYRCPISGT